MEKNLAQVTKLLEKVFKAGFLTEKDILAIAGLSVICLISSISSVHFLLLPSELIVLANHQTLILPKGVTVSLDSVSKVSFLRSSGKGISYRWGSVTIFTYSGKHKIRYVADCQNVAIQLNKLVRNAKRNQA